MTQLPLVGAPRFFCGPNAHKSAALAKQQKKRPRGDQKQADAAAAAAAVEESESEVGPWSFLCSDA